MRKRIEPEKKRAVTKQGTFTTDEAIEIERYCTLNQMTESDLIRQSVLKTIKYKKGKL